MHLWRNPGRPRDPGCQRPRRPAWARGAASLEAWRESPGAVRGPPSLPHPACPVKSLQEITGRRRPPLPPPQPTPPADLLCSLSVVATQLPAHFQDQLGDPGHVRNGIQGLLEELWGEVGISGLASGRGARQPWPSVTFLAGGREGGLWGVPCSGQRHQPKGRPVPGVMNETLCQQPPAASGPSAHILGNTLSPHALLPLMLQPQPAFLHVGDSAQLVQVTEQLLQISHRRQPWPQALPFPPREAPPQDSGTLRCSLWGFYSVGI